MLAQLRPLTAHLDERGRLTEIHRASDDPHGFGQAYITTASAGVVKPGIATSGNGIGGIVSRVRPRHEYDPAAPDEERLGAFDLPFCWEITSR